MNNFNDVGFGCSYRNIQTILSCYKTNYPSKFDKVDINNKDIPDIRELLYYFNNDYQNKIDKYIIECCISIDHLVKILEIVRLNNFNKKVHAKNKQKTNISSAIPIGIPTNPKGALTIQHGQRL